MAKVRKHFGKGRRTVRIFINLGEKDGLTTGKLVGFIAESTDVEPNIIERVTVRDLSSYFNVPGDAAEYIIEHLSQKKFKGRKVRLEIAEQRTGGGGSGDYRGGGEGRSPRPQSSRFTGDVRSYSNRETAFRGKRKP